MRNRIAIGLLFVVIHLTLVAALVIPFGWDVMHPLLEFAIIAFSGTVAVVTVRLGQEEDV
jgi:hypothetical protein